MYGFLKLSLVGKSTFFPKRVLWKFHVWDYNFPKVEKYSHFNVEKNGKHDFQSWFSWHPIM